MNVTGGTGTPVSNDDSGAGYPSGTGAHFGAVKSFNSEKGFGFVIGPDGADIFLHIKSVVDGGVPQAGDKLQFDVEPNPTKDGQMRTKNVTGGSGWQPKGKGDNGMGKGGMKGGYGPMEMMNMMWAMASKGGPYGKAKG